MKPPAQVGAALQRAATAPLARRLAKQIAPAKGLRGTPGAAITAVLVDVWTHSPPRLPRDAGALQTLFSAAHEDGLVAVGLVSALVPDRPDAALGLAEDWVELVDDLPTADALGWLVWGPALLATGADVPRALLSVRGQGHFRRRAAVMAAMACVPTPVEGPAAAALRERLGQRRIAFVDEAMDAIVDPVASHYITDEDPQVRKALGRLLRAWAAASPDAVEAMVARQRGGIPRRVRQDVDKGLRKGRRRRGAAS